MPGVPASKGYQGGFSSALMLKDLNLAMEVGCMGEKVAEREERKRMREGGRWG
jgi:hypothetical protein